MMVCAHGDVADYCAERDMQICDVCEGDFRNYRGPCRVLVTDKDMSAHEYYFLKGEMLGVGIELISTKHKDDKILSEYLVYANGRRKEKRSGRPAFDDETVIQRILELRDAGLSIREIQATEGICGADGRKFSVSTIHRIIKERKNEV